MVFVNSRGLVGLLLTPPFCFSLKGELAKESALQIPDWQVGGWEEASV